MKQILPGFLLMEATIAVLMSIILSSIMVLYLGKAATLRADIRNRSYALSCALETMEGVLSGSIAHTHAACTVQKIPLLTSPLCTGIDLVLPPLAHSVLVRAQSMVLCSWTGR
ncbi:MAG: hypothetical protein ACHQVS_02410 [Candidatus Babeliales bacterium]